MVSPNVLFLFYLLKLFHLDHVPELYGQESPHNLHIHDRHLKHDKYKYRRYSSPRGCLTSNFDVLAEMNHSSLPIFRVFVLIWPFEKFFDELLNDWLLEMTSYQHLDGDSSIDTSPQ